jgi:drug/metabolite transporter (DMT)-like permease
MRGFRAMPSNTSLPRLTMGPLEWTLLITLGVLWGTSFVLSKVALRELPPFSLVFVRLTLTSLLLLAWLRVSGAYKGPVLGQSRRVWGGFLGMGVLNILLPYSFTAWGQMQLPSGLASIITASTPLFSVVFAHFLTRDERMSVRKVAGVLLGISGVAFIIGFDALRGAHADVLAHGSLTCAAIVLAMAGIYGRRLAAVPPAVSATGQCICAAAITLPVALAFDRPWTLAMPGALTWTMVVALAVFGTAFAYLIYFRLLASSGSTNLMLVTLLIPVSALLLGAATLGEHIDARQLVGMALIGLGLAVIDGRPLAWLRARAAGA